MNEKLYNFLNDPENGIEKKEAKALFEELKVQSYHAPAQPFTRSLTGEAGLVRFVDHPGVFPIARTEILPSFLQPMEKFFQQIMGDDFSPSSGAFPDYKASWTTPGLESLIAGQLCYMSWEEGKRTPAEQLPNYLLNILQNKHGSILEHTNVSMVIYGIGRDLSHEWIRHRAGWGYSQVSQRYVSNRFLRFTTRKEIGFTTEHYQMCASALRAYNKAVEILQDKLISKKDVSRSWLRKKVRQAARAYLPNCVETVLYVTGNLRAWRTFLDQRSSPHADTSAQEVAIRCFQVLQSLYPHHFQDYDYWAQKDEYGIWRVGVCTKNVKV